MISFSSFIEMKLYTEEDAPGGLPPAGGPAGGPPAGGPPPGGGAPPMPMPPMGGGGGGPPAGGPAPGGAGGQQPSKKLKAVNFWDVAQKIVDEEEGTASQDANAPKEGDNAEQPEMAPSPDAGLPPESSPAGGMALPAGGMDMSATQTGEAPPAGSPPAAPM